MPMLARAPAADRSLFRGYRFPADVIAHAVWLYFRFQLSLRDVQVLLAEHGLTLMPRSASTSWTSRWAQMEAEVQPHRMAVDLGGEAVTAVERYGRQVSGHRQILLGRPSINLSTPDRFHTLAAGGRRSTASLSGGTAAADMGWHTLVRS